MTEFPNFLLVRKSISTTKTFECDIIHEIQIYFYYIENSNNSWNSTRSFNDTPLGWAAGNGHAKIVKLLLSKPDIDVNCKNI